MTDIPFNSPLVLGTEESFIKDAISRGQFCAGGHYNRLCEVELEKLSGAHKALMTSSCTHALEMCALLLNIKEGDEVIMASFNFVSAANAFVLRGAKIVFVDIRQDTLNIDENLIEAAITERTKAILVMHYGGVACEMDTIMSLSQKYNIKVVEDAAHCIDAYYKGRHLGTIGDLGTISFHSTKNIHCGEGGALLINNKKYIDRAYIIREKGTNRRQFINGLVEKYTWVDLGSSYLMSEISAAFLYPQLQAVKAITKKRMEIVSYYSDNLRTDEVAIQSKNGNGHIFYLKLGSREARKIAIGKLKSDGVKAYFHYIPLHSSFYRSQQTWESGQMPITDNISDRILRLPLSYSLEMEQLEYIVKKVLCILNENSSRNKKRVV